MTAQDLKNSILQLAVQGKLVPQDPSDEPASELLKQCAAKSFQENYEDVLPFDIPSSWEWTKLGDIVSVIGGTSYKSNETSKTGVRILRGGNIQKSEVLYFDNDVFLPVSFLDVEKTIKNGDVLIVASTGSKAVVGKPGFVFEDDENTQIGAFLRIVRPKYLSLAPYIRTIFDSEYYRSHIRNQVQGMNINNVKNEHITEFIVPIPPLAEQARIVAKIEELLPLIESYGDTEERLKKLNTEFPDKLRKSILQQAVQGKLTERDPADKPASELLTRIRAERAVLQKNKAAKKSQANETIAVDEIPFDIPDTWEWVNLGWICQKVGAGSTPKGGSAVYVPEGIKFLREQNVHDDGLHLDGVVYIDEKTHSAKAGSQVQPQDILMNITGGSIGRNALVPDDFDTANVNQHVLIIRLVDKELRHYLHYCFSSPAVLNQMFTKQAGDKPGLSATKVENFLIPIPPLAEQKRIVARVEELLAVCDGLK